MQKELTSGIRQEQPSAGIKPKELTASELQELTEGYLQGELTAGELHELTEGIIN